MPAAGPFVTAATMSLNHKADRLAGDCIKEKLVRGFTEHRKRLKKGNNICMTTLSLSRSSPNTSVDSTLQKN